MTLQVKGIKYIPVFIKAFLHYTFIITATISGAGYREIKGEVYALQKIITNRGPGK